MDLKADIYQVGRQTEGGEDIRQKRLLRKNH